MHETLGDGYIVDGGKRIFADEDIGTGRDATQLRHQEANAWQEEIANVIRSTGVSLNAASETIAQMTQLNTAINQKISVLQSALQGQITANKNSIDGHTVDIANSEAEITALNVGLYDLTVAVSSLTADSITNDSGVSGTKVKDALNTLLAADAALTAAIAALTANNIINDSSVVGAKVKDALNTLKTTITNLVASNIANDSSVSGTTIKDALNTLLTNSNLQWNATTLLMMGGSTTVITNGQSKHVDVNVSVTPGWTNLDNSDIILVSRRGPADLNNWGGTWEAGLTVSGVVVNASTIRFGIGNPMPTGYTPNINDLVSVRVIRKV